MPIARAVSLVCQLLTALDYAHARGFVHRDVKPANLVVTVLEGRDVVKLSDFGLSRIYQSTSMSGLTLDGDLGGSPAFMAPEQFTELRNALPSVDQYSAGALLYTLLTERFPYDFPERLEQKIMKILLEDPVPIRARRHGPSRGAGRRHRSRAGPKAAGPIRDGEGDGSGARPFRSLSALPSDSAAPAHVLE